MSLADAKVVGNRVDAGEREPIGGGQDQAGLRAVTARTGKAVGDCAFEQRGGFGRSARGGEPVEQTPSRGRAPQLVERDDASGDGGGRHADHGLGRAQVQTRHHDALTAA
jgi:hypothetical protein